MTHHFPKKVLGSRISLTYKRLNENLTTNLGKILRSFENRAPDVKSETTEPLWHAVDQWPPPDA